MLGVKGLLFGRFRTERHQAERFCCKSWWKWEKSSQKSEPETDKSSVVNGLMVNFARIKRKIDCKHYSLTLCKYRIIFQSNWISIILENIAKFSSPFWLRRLVFCWTGPDSVVWFNRLIIKQLMIENSTWLPHQNTGKFVTKSAIQTHALHLSRFNDFVEKGVLGVKVLRTFLRL